MVEKIYPYPRGTVINAICDLVELQKGKSTFSDTPNGKIFYRVTMYFCKYEFRFTVTDIDESSSQVSLEVAGTELGANDMSRRQIALLDSMLGDLQPKA